MTALDEEQDLVSLIRQIVREEVQRLVASQVQNPGVADHRRPREGRSGEVVSPYLQTERVD